MAANVVIDVIARDKASKTFTQVGKEVDKTHSKLASLAGAFAGGALAKGAFSFVKGGIADIQAAQKVSVQTAQVIKTMGGVAGVSKSHVEGLADSIEKMSGLEAENIQAGENMLLTFDKIRGANFDRATKAMADMTARMGGDAVGAATMLGKALNDPAKGISALTRVGVSFTAAQKHSIQVMQEHGNVAAAQQVILASLESQFGGAAKAAGQTMAGKIQILQARFGDVRQELVANLLPAFTKLASGLSSAIGFWQRNASVLTPVAIVLGTVVGATIAVNKAMAAGSAIKAAYIALTGGQAAATAAAAESQVGLNVAMSANPIGLIIVGIAGLAAGLIYAYKHSEKFRNIVQTGFTAVKVAFEAVWGALKAGFAWVSSHWKLLASILTGPIGAAAIVIATHWSSIVNGVKAVVHTIGSVFRTVTRAITAPFAAAFATIKSLWNNTLGGFHIGLPKMSIPGLGSVGGQGFTIPKMAEGGIVKARPGGILANLGEGRYDEAVIPLKGNRPGGDVVEVHFHGPVYGARGTRQLADDLVADLEIALNRRRNLGITG